ENLLKVAETYKPEPLVPPGRVYGVTERMDAQGEEVVALNEQEVADAADALVAQGVDTIAIAFLWSIRNDAHERRAKEIVAGRAGRRCSGGCRARSRGRWGSASAWGPR